MHAIALLLQNQPDAATIKQMMVAMFAIIPIIIVVGIGIVIVPAWFVLKKAGFSPWLSLLVMVPLGGLILLYVLAFAEWKVVPAPQQSWGPPPFPPPPPYPPQA